MWRVLHDQTQGGIFQDSRRFAATVPVYDSSRGIRRCSGNAGPFQSCCAHDTGVSVVPVQKNRMTGSSLVQPVAVGPGIVLEKMFIPAAADQPVTRCLSGGIFGNEFHEGFPGPGLVDGKCKQTFPAPEQMQMGIDESGSHDSSRQINHPGLSRAEGLQVISDCQNVFAGQGQLGNPGLTGILSKNNAVLKKDVCLGSAH
jgi:hypothetical protein